MHDDRPACFHCGQPVPADGRWLQDVLGAPRDFCCPGCRAVAQTIVDNGLGDYYRHRTAPGGRVEQVPDLLERFRIYDHPEVQRGFVHAGGNWREAHLILEEVRCAACLWLNERHLRAQAGVLEVDVDYASQRARVRWDPAVTELSRLLEALAAIGYAAHPYDAAHRQTLDRDQRRRSTSRILFAGLLGMPVMQFSLATYVTVPDLAAPLPLWVELGRWSMLLAVTAILAYAGQEFFLGAWRDLRNRRLGMDVPIVVGLSAAWVGSLWSTARGSGEVYMDTIAMFVLFVLVARAYELTGRREAAAAMDRLAMVVPEEARRVDGDGVERRVPAVDLAPGDRIRLRPGETTPVDGVVLQGTSVFDESLLTGESRPVAKGPGAWVVAGTCNQHQPVELRVERVGRASTVGEVHGLLQRGLAIKPRYAVLASHAARVFVPVVLLAATVTALLWWWIEPSRALENAIAVLIVTCPCALALATPVAVALGAGRFANAGVLPLDMSAIEPLAAVDTVCLDKTGTLTTGGFVLRHVDLLADAGREEVMAMAATLERDSSHPLARAFRQAAHGEVEGVTEVLMAAGQGVQARRGSAQWRLGTWGYATAGAQADADITRRMAAWRSQGLSVCVLSRDTRPVALFGLHDGLREGATEMVQELTALGIGHIAVLSGDHPDAVQSVAAKLGITDARGGLSAADKLAWIHARQAAGHRVLMVGDGINDVPVLAAADVSVSFGEATHLAQYHSHLVLLSENLAAIPRAVTLARRTRRIVLQNLLWAGSYNLTTIPLAVMGLVPPWAAAIGMSLSSLLVVGNAMRLRREKGKRRGVEPTRPLPAPAGALSRN
jgi:P-type Cu2+ transporter